MPSAASLRRNDEPSLAERSASKRIVVTGSMAFLTQMQEIKKQLDLFQVPTVVPDDVDIGLSHHDDRSYLAFKKAISISHINKIKDPRTYAVLVANFDKNGVFGYIGANSFAEISVAFSARKKIFLLSEIPPPYVDELSAWGAVVLNGDLARLVRTYEVSCRHASAQLKFPQF